MISFFSVKDVYETSVLSLISNLLVSGENSPFYRSLIESNLGSGYAPMCGYVNEIPLNLKAFILNDPRLRFAVLF